jgi:hypothetical protein
MQGTREKKSGCGGWFPAMRRPSVAIYLKFDAEYVVLVFKFI